MRPVLWFRPVCPCPGVQAFQWIAQQLGIERDDGLGHEASAVIPPFNLPIAGAADPFAIDLTARPTRCLTFVRPLAVAEYFEEYRLRKVSRLAPHFCPPELTCTMPFCIGGCGSVNRYWNAWAPSTLNAAIIETSRLDMNSKNLRST